MNKPQAMIIAADRSRLHKCWMTVYAEFDGASLVRFCPGAINIRNLRDFEALGSVFVPVAWFFCGHEIVDAAGWSGATTLGQVDTPANVPG